MCTAISYDYYFGRNLDIEHSYNEKVCITPRRYPFVFRNGKILREHYAIIGTAAVIDGYPLYYDATNEKGLSLAGLNFPENAVYYDENAEKENIAPFELIPYVLGCCSCVDEALEKLENVNLHNISFSAELPLTPLHWILADERRAVTLEPLKDGLKIHENPVGVLTNNPPFDYHMNNLSNYINLTVEQPENRFSDKLELKPVSFGMGAIGLPGDLSSPSRFIRATFAKLNFACGETEEERVNGFFHNLCFVAQLKGLNRLQSGEYEFTLYSSCCNTRKGIYYYTTYENGGITAVDMHKTDLDSDGVVSYPLIRETRFLFQN